MSKRLAFLILLSFVALVPTVTVAAEDLVEYVYKSCDAEITNYCSQVVPGDGRLLACFYAHGDKISSTCEYALYSASAELEQFAAAVTHLAKACHEDLLEHCGDVEMGEGRVGECLLDHEEEVNETCRAAIAATGLEMSD